jgi:hypothetical protein
MTVIETGETGLELVSQDFRTGETAYKSRIEAELMQSPGVLRIKPVLEVVFERDLYVSRIL